MTITGHLVACVSQANPSHAPSYIPFVQIPVVKCAESEYKPYSSTTTKMLFSRKPPNGHYTAVKNRYKKALSNSKEIY